MEKPMAFAIVESQLRCHSPTTATLAHNRHIMRITAKGHNIGFHPLQCETLIKKACIARWKRLVRHETEGTKTIANIDCNKILALANPVAEVVVWRCTVL
jgi:hypothetical protein